MKFEQVPNMESGDYKDRAKVNGIEISINKVSSGEYEIFMPGVDMSVTGDEVINISKNTEEAKAVFGFAKKKAEDAQSAEDVYKAVKDFVKKYATK